MIGTGSVVIFQMEPVRHFVFPTFLPLSSKSLTMVTVVAVQTGMAVVMFGLVETMTTNGSFAITSFLGTHKLMKLFVSLNRELEIISGTHHHIVTTVDLACPHVHQHSSVNDDGWLDE